MAIQLSINLSHLFSADTDVSVCHCGDSGVLTART